MLASIQLQLTSIVFKGVPTRFPRLRLAFLEAGATWLVPYLDRLDEHWELRGQVETPDLPRRPSEVIREGPYYFSIEPEETLLPEAVSHVGAEHFMYAGDYPHWDSAFPHNIAELRDDPRLSDEDKRRLFYDNAREFYGLGVGAAARGVVRGPGCHRHDTRTTHGRKAVGWLSMANLFQAEQEGKRRASKASRCGGRPGRAALRRTPGGECRRP